MKVIKNHLKLDEKSDENAIVNAIETIENRANIAETLNEELENSITEKDQEIANATETIENANTEISGLKKTIAENAVDVAIDAGKFQKENRSELVDQAVEMGVEKFNNMVKAMKSTPVKIIDQLKNDQSDVDGKTFRQLEKENPTVLNNLKKSDPTKYAELFKKEYGVEYSA
jgi:Txe/YoeB family toxin of Txe-Axe toxin-antitoxin module